MQRKVQLPAQRHTLISVEFEEKLTSSHSEMFTIIQNLLFKHNIENDKKILSRSPMKSHRSVINDHQFSPGEIKSQIKFYSQILQFVKITVIHNGNKAILLNQNKIQKQHRRCSLNLKIFSFKLFHI